MKKIVSVTLITALIFGSSALSYGMGYTDVKSTNWAYDAVNTMSSQSIIKGYPDGSFKPNNTVTYGEFIKMALIASTGADVGNTSSGHWATNYYNKALELKYFTAYDIDRSQLKNDITRAHMALIISSILGDVKIDNYDEIQEGISDITYQTEYEYDITKSYASGILTGYTDKTFRPEKTLSRAEAATVIYRLVDKSKRELPEGKEESDTGNFEDVVKNSDSFINPGDGSINEDLASTTSYEIITDASKYGMSLGENRGTKWVLINNSDELGWLYLMKDGNIIEFMDSMPLPDGARTAGYEADITQIDYIVSVTSDNKALLIVNPFKK